MAYKDIEKKRAYDRKWRRDHPGLAAEAVRRWNAEHPDYQRKWREEHREEFNEYHRDYNRRNKGYVKRWKEGLAARGLKLVHYVKPDGRPSMRVVSINTGLPVKRGASCAR